MLKTLAKLVGFSEIYYYKLLQFFQTGFFQLHLSEIRHTGVFGGAMGSGTMGSVQIGLMVEPLTAIEGRAAAEGTQATQQISFLSNAFVLRLCEISVYFGGICRNHVTKFSKPCRIVHNQISQTRWPSFGFQNVNILGYADFIPVSALQEWYNNFRRRFEQNPYFWRSLRTV
ncbi:unnamed protein product [Strongylus vulgaris]|uniref:Hikeshi-like C-terminal domain-containing protein n=1 Tax=Strongylus vulgaris TaxID=40348 RepID=A0A3P7KD78_STRVU|nr:unnamed protein product [Strongylus vulgaris]